jgi:hypothetical protein
VNDGAAQLLMAVAHRATQAWDFAGATIIDHGSDKHFDVP